MACRELDDALGLTETANECLQESRGGRNVQHQLVALLRQSVYSRLAGYEDTNDAERLSDDPTMRVIVGRRGGTERKAASTNTMSRFETEVLTQDGNVEGLDRLNAKWVDGAISHTAHRRVILDMDSSESPVHGEQEGALYNGHFGSMCYHPLFVFNQFGDCEGAMLRAGSVHSAHRWRDVLEPILARYERTGVRRYFRADAAFAKPDIYDYHQGELFPRVGFIATKHVGWPGRGSAFLQWSWDSRAVDQRGQVRAELDSAVLPSVRGQSSASVSVHPGLQPWELPAPVMPAQRGQALVAEERPGQADQDGRSAGAPLPAVDLSVVRGVGS